MGIFRHDLTRSERIPETVREADDLFVSMGVRGSPVTDATWPRHRWKWSLMRARSFCANTTTGNTATRSLRLVT